MIGVRVGGGREREGRSGGGRGRACCRIVSRARIITCSCLSDISYCPFSSRCPSVTWKFAHSSLPEFHFFYLHSLFSLAFPFFISPSLSLLCEILV